jgi:replication factor C small subunit
MNVYTYDIIQSFLPQSHKIIGELNEIKFSNIKTIFEADSESLVWLNPTRTDRSILLQNTLAKIIINHIDCDSLYINASDERGIDTIRDKVQGFASSASFKPLKIIILDEADFLTIQAQASLRNIIETYSRTTRFILTCNYLERIIDPLQSRCQVLKITPPSKKEVAQHVANVLDQEDISYENFNIAFEKT